MHILLITDNFPPETNASAIRCHEHSREWVRMGHKVTVITGAPNFPAGKVFEGYRNRLIQREIVDGIQVVRVWTYIAPNTGTFRRTIDFASFMVSAIFAGLFVRKPDAVLATTPQFLTSIAGWIVARLKRCPFVLELRDLWPESIVAIGVMGHSRMYRAMEWVARLIYRRADTIIVVTHSFKRILGEMGIDTAKIHIITNGVHPDHFNVSSSPEEIRRHYDLPTDRFLVSYVGTFGMAHNLTTVLEVAKRTLDEPAIQYLLVGDGADRARLIEQSESEGLSNVRFIERQTHASALEVLAASDVALVLLRDTPLFESVISSKLFEAMALGKPVILGVRGESLAIINKHQCGIGIKPENSVDLEVAIRNLQMNSNKREIMGTNGRKAVEMHYNRVTLARDMAALLLGLRS